MDKLLATENEQSVTCNFCGNPMTLIELGPQKYRVWTHRGKYLDTCLYPCVRLEQNFMAVLLARMKKFKWKMGIQMIDGRMKFHGEK